MKKILISIFSILLLMSSGYANSDATDCPKDEVDVQFTSFDTGGFICVPLDDIKNNYDSKCVTFSPKVQRISKSARLIDDINEGCVLNKDKHKKLLDKSEGINKTQIFDKKSEELTKKDTSTETPKNEKISELEANAKAMKDKENSTENKLLGAGAMGAAGVGGSQLLQGMAEKSVDTKSENDMKAYMATFKCDYGQGQNVNGGEKEVVLPGANVLAPMYTEYKTLAADLKNIKTALGMTPGIESETIFDKANTGLYDNASIGKTSGAFASISDALAGDAAAAAAWDAQKAEAANKVTTGAVAAGAGILGGAVGNMLINKNSARESSDNINAKYAKIAASAKQIQASIDQETETIKLDCGTEANLVGTDCICKDTTKNYTSETKQCVANPTVDCGSDPHIFPLDDNTCACDSGFDIVGKACLCKSPKKINGQSCEYQIFIKKTNFANSNNFIPLLSNVSKTETSEKEPIIQEEVKVIASINLKSPSFDSNKSDIKNPFDLKLKEFADQNKNNQDGVCYVVSGNTDKTGTLIDNQNLSLQRAESATKILTANGINYSNIKTVGNGFKNCELSGSADSCRNVTVEVMSASCPQS